MATRQAPPSKDLNGYIMQINVTFDSSVNQAPAGFISAVNYVVNYFDSLFTNNVTINIDVLYQNLGSGILGENQESAVSTTYSSVRSALHHESRHLE
jgi:hypothetical protein